MVRFRVIKGSHILLAVAVVVLAIVLGFIFFQGGISSQKSSQQNLTSAEIVQSLSDEEAEAKSAFASTSSYVQSLNIEVLADTPEPDPLQNAKSILIYHTHTHEAYAQDSSDPYEAIETWRTADEEHSVVRVGSALASLLTDLGYRVIHDKTDHEQDSIDDAYLRSLETLKGYQESFDLRIDLHRDAYVDGLQNSLEGSDGQSYAQLMLLVGRGDQYPENERPPYEENLAFAQRLTNELNARIPGICRNVTVKSGRYNQHTDKRCILVEVGHNLNTLDEALASIPCLANSIDTILKRESANDLT